MKSFFKVLLIISLIISLNEKSFSQNFRKTATAGFVFLELPVNARTTGMGESGITLSDLNSDGIFVNPAICGFTNRIHNVSFSYSPYFAEIKQYAASYSFNSPFGVLSVGALLFDYGSMPKTQKVAGQRVYDILGTFNSKSLAFALSYSRMLTDKFSFGLSLKYVNEKIDVYSADNVVLDGGVLYYTGLGSLRIGATIQNFGTDAKFINDPFKMPAVLKLGAAAEIFGDYNSDYRVTTIMEAIHPNDGDERVNTGLELSWKNIFTIRGGYKFFYDEETYSFGLGINGEPFVPVSFDVSISNYGRLGNILRLTLQAGIL
ncbi:MAG: PorV/PorQ family protein [Ignavibacteria bacterium]|nr:PorV/PorQ family protein [Ignavibacteria bacterium]